MEAYQLSDEERVELALINGATKGDNETLGELFDRYQPLVRRLWLNCSIANLDRQDWQQEAFLVLDRAVHNYRQEQRTRFCWYYRQLLTNRLRDLYRQTRAAKRIPAQLVQDLNVENDVTMIQDPVLTPEQIVMWRASYQEFLAQCSTNEREAYLLESEGRDLTEIAQVMGCSERKVKNALHRARAKLKKHLG